ncbi:MAG: ABC transporter substrate-binding protein [Deltaproteobacteria bacterium]|nr:ABC transporter substrate-binding protein [Deltaproteobacteria bacterium]
MRIVFSIVVVFLCLAASANAQPVSSGSCERVISLAPSITEILFALGLGDRVVGVSRYSDYPVEARAKPRVGALLDPNFEAIVALRPTIVLGLSEFREKLPYLESLGLKTETFEHRTLRGIDDSIRRIGALCGQPQQAGVMADDILRRIEVVKARVKGRPEVRTMVVVGESSGDGTLTSLFLSGTDGFYNEVLSLAGGRNVVTSKTLGISTISAEGVMHLNPDVVIEIVLANGGQQLNHATIRQAWSDVPSVAAVKNNKIFIVDQDYVSVPGPRFVRVLEDFARYLHPDA